MLQEVCCHTKREFSARGTILCISWRTFRIFFTFSARGGGRGSPRPPGGGRFFIENPRGRGGVLQEGKGAEGPGGCLRRIGDFGGVGGNFFFQGRNVHQDLLLFLKDLGALLPSRPDYWGSFLLTVRAFLALQPAEVLLRHTFSL